MLNHQDVNYFFTLWLIFNLDLIHVLAKLLHLHLIFSLMLTLRASRKASVVR